MKGFVLFLYFNQNQIPAVIKTEAEVTQFSEDATWQFLAEQAIKVQLPAHQFFLDTL